MIKAGAFLICAFLAAPVFAGGGAEQSKANPLAGTTWVWVDSQSKKHIVEYSATTVSFVIYNPDGAVYQKSTEGVYTLSGNILTETYGDFTATSSFSENAIIDTTNQNIVFLRQTGQSTSSP
jgi:hypothetical protein